VVHDQTQVWHGVVDGFTKTTESGLKPATVMTAMVATVPSEDIPLLCTSSWDFRAFYMC